MKFLATAAALALGLMVAVPADAGWGCRAKRSRTACGGSYGGYSAAYSAPAASSCGSHGGYAAHSSSPTTAPCQSESPCSGDFATASYTHGSHGGVTYAAASQGDCGCNGAGVTTASYNEWSVQPSSAQHQSPTPAQYERAPEPPSPANNGSAGQNRPGSGDSSSQQTGDALEL